MREIKINEILTEAQLMKKFSFTKRQLETLRFEREFPYIPAAKNVRLYNSKSVVEWLLERERNKKT